MPRKNRGRSRGKDARHIRLYHTMLRTPAWRSLTPQAVGVYLLLEERHNGTNNGEIGLSVRDAARACNINKDTAARALRELEEKGFIKRRSLGAFTYKLRHAAEFELTAWSYDGQPATRDFARWSEGKESGPKPSRSRPSKSDTGSA